MLVDHDRGVMETLVAQGASADAVFSDGRRQLKVWTVDRGRIERDTGVDLVFLNRDFNSLLLLQYKCMKLGAKTGQWSYRPDPQFHLELERMQDTESLIKKRTPQENGLKDIRLNLGSLYFKFCKRLPLSKQDGSLAEGMLLSLATTEAVLEDQRASHNSKLKIGYETCDRSLNNTTFANLARDGWIGTRGLSDKDYRAIVGFDETDDSRSLVIAESISAPGGRIRQSSR